MSASSTNAAVTSEEGLDINKVIECIGPSLGNKWSDLAIQLFDSDDRAVNSIEHDKKSITEQLRAVLIHWKKIPAKVYAREFKGGII
ncbi:death domain-containing protein [Parendozoicomonas sp. Alg238-R29]|uniref:death domain-containing protein n=1 Tax=Parendozoicomonas sp. Alg238-R29 TaxID=2993446 RepID=UPI00248DA86C|nr:death domain-containing protein [Parendozoicomonas sp. Alg238-R29]